jgi:glycosyltransferase involved in cell wall biosynthesis
MTKIQSITIISTGQPAGNPRLVKEANALSEIGFEVTVIYSHWASWALLFDKQIINSANWKAYLAGGNPINNKTIFFFTRLKHKIFSTLSNYTFGFLFAEKTQARAYSELLKLAKTHKPQLYIAHNLGALSVAAMAAKFYNLPFAFDAEDFHRQETTDNFSDKDYRLKKYLEEKYLPKATYISAASPLIEKAYKTLFPNQKFITIQNVFSKPKSGNIISKNQNLRLVWFSQTIGKNRGLEQVLEALKKLQLPVELTLIGAVSDEIKHNFSDSYLVNFIPTLHPDELISYLSQFDIGLALEQKTPFNRNICLTNKIFSYLSAGIAIIATDTEAQTQFLSKHPQIGKLYKSQDITALADIILYYFYHKKELQEAKNQSIHLAINQYNVEMEYQKLLDIINPPSSFNRLPGSDSR